jgi:hypothetical protein
MLGSNDKMPLLAFAPRQAAFCKNILRSFAGII